ncbi:hypothetical protein FAES_0269 [Fibrella aestuarina BUZ 2]|uniref:Uncharacterized protein n=1 Tax=Fibrella aestuarina BUZ 2 TaxID=1166018 RepID=I0K2D0_9BACT|nr:hypothetical protein FAES_0269 [Fibrella aestuarina BUZ 2]
MCTGNVDGGLPSFADKYRIQFTLFYLSDRPTYL